MICGSETNAGRSAVIPRNRADITPVSQHDGVDPVVVNVVVLIEGMGTALKIHAGAGGA